MYIKSLFFSFLLIASQNVLAEINAPKYVFKGGQNNTSSKNVYHGGSINNNQAPQQQIARNDNNTQNQVGTAANPYYVPNGGTDFWSYPRKLHIKRPATGEEVNVIYWANGKIVPEGYKQLSWVMRDVKAGQAVNMDVRLFDLMYAIQSWVSYYGYRTPLIITSGYRSPKTNNSTEGAAKNSLHTQGKATDFYIQGLPWEYVGRLAAAYSAGGVGFYPGQRFIHIDTGRVRYCVHGLNYYPSKNKSKK